MILRLLFVVGCCGYAIAVPTFTFKCSAALLCVDENMCNIEGTISDSPQPPPETPLPRIVCKKTDGSEGVCCRDPNYKDDWPADYVDPGLKPKATRAGVDESPIKPPPPNKPPTRPEPSKVQTELPKPSVNPLPPAPPARPILPPIEEPPPSSKKPEEKQQIQPKKPTRGGIKKQKNFVNTGCPERNRTALADLNPGAWVPGDFDSGHGEFLWQAGVFDSNLNFLCGCYITDQFTCTTTASCTKSYLSNPSKIKVVVGLYDLTNFDLSEPNGTPKPSQISDVAEIIPDPNGRDISVLALDVKNTPIEFNFYTAPICIDLPEGLKVFDYDNCVVTGFGKTKTTAHWYDVKLLSESECSSIVKGFNPNYQSCAQADSDICDQVEFGNGLQCRYRGTRNDRDVRDVYWLRGVFNDWVCTPGSNVIVYTHLDMSWFDRLLKKREDYIRSLNLDF